VVKVDREPVDVRERVLHDRVWQPGAVRHDHREECATQLLSRRHVRRQGDESDALPRASALLLYVWTRNVCGEKRAGVSKWLPSKRMRLYDSSDTR